MLTGILATALGVHAAEPATAAPRSDGSWAVEFLVPAPVERVRALLADPIAAARFSPDIVATTYLTRGECPTLRAVLAGVVSLSYDYRRCTTPDGWHETLVGSAGLDAYEVRWSLAAEGASTRVGYAVRVDPALPAPSFLVSRQIRSSMETIRQRLTSAATLGTASADD